MGSDWKEIKFSELCAITRGASPRPIKEFVKETGMPWVKIADATATKGRTISSTNEFIKKEGVAKSVEVYQGDLILTNSATPGLPMFVGINACIHDGWMLLRNFKGLNKNFAYWLLLHERRNLVMQGNGSVFTNLKTDILKNHVVKIPSLEEQKEIAYRLDLIAEKIELNQQTNETLEAMAQAMFKSWFVDFDPVRAKMKAKTEGFDPDKAAMAAIAGVSSFAKASEDKSAPQNWEDVEAALDQKLASMTEAQRNQLQHTAELFTDELVESELGEVPKGWEYDQLGNFITVKRGGSPRPIKDFVVDEGLHWTKISDATSENSPFIMSTKEFIKEEGLKKTILLEKGSLILSNSATPGLPKFLNIDACIHDGWLYFPIKDHFTDLYLYHLFIEIRKALVAKGSGTVFTNLKTSILRNYDLVIPNKELVMKFNEMAQNTFESLLNNRKEIETLSKLRDTLLPKLISGEIEV